VSGNAVASAADRRRLRLIDTETHYHHLFGVDRVPLSKIQRLLDGIVRLSM